MSGQSWFQECPLVPKGRSKLQKLQIIIHISIERFFPFLHLSDFLFDNTSTEITGQAGLEAVFQVPMPGDSGSSPNAGSIFKLLLDPGDFSLQPQRNPTSSLTPPSG